MIEGIHWLGHASFRLDGADCVYIDPYKIRGGPPADIVLVSHGHYDHCSPAAIDRVRAEATVLVAGTEWAKRLKGDVRVIAPGKTLAIGSTTIEAVPAYTTKKPFHPRAEGGLGFIIAAGGRRVYFAGDTDLIPEMASVRADVALLPVSGTYVMTAEEAAQAVRLIKPAVAVPMHYGAIVGSRGDAVRFAELAGAMVDILEKE